MLKRRTCVCANKFSKKKKKKKKKIGLKFAEVNLSHCAVNDDVN